MIEDEEDERIGCPSVEAVRNSRRISQSSTAPLKNGKLTVTNRPALNIVSPPRESGTGQEEDAGCRLSGRCR